MSSNWDIDTAIGVIESGTSATDDTSAVGEAWAVVMDELTRLRTENAALRERCRVLEKAMRPAVVLMWERIEAIAKNTGKTMDYLRQVAVGCDKALAGATDAADAMEES